MQKPRSSRLSTPYTGPVVKIEPGPAWGKKTIRFGTTARMSAYLIALAVGGSICEESCGSELPLRLRATGDKRRLGRSAVQAAAATLAYFNRYLAIDYPVKKLDLVAVADSAAGAMANVGAVFFRESLLLLGEEASLAAGASARCSSSRTRLRTGRRAGRTRGRCRPVRRLAAAENAETPEQRYRFLYALPAFREPELIRRDRAIFLGRILSNPEAREPAWRAISDRWKRTLAQTLEDIESCASLAASQRPLVSSR